MLRECLRVLKPGGRAAGFVIWAPETLTEVEAALAADLGPSEVLSPVSPEALLRAAGFVSVAQTDTTASFERTSEALVTRREGVEAELRRLEGDELFEEEQVKKRATLEGIRRGLLRRCLVVGEAPGDSSTVAT